MACMPAANARSSLAGVPGVSPFSLLASSAAPELPVSSLPSTSAGGKSPAPVRPSGPLIRRANSNSTVAAQALTPSTHPPYEGAGSGASSGRRAASVRWSWRRLFVALVAAWLCVLWLLLLARPRLFWSAAALVGSSHADGSESRLHGWTHRWSPSAMWVAAEAASQVRAAATSQAGATTGANPAASRREHMWPAPEAQQARAIIRSESHATTREARAVLLGQAALAARLSLAAPTATQEEAAHKRATQAVLAAHAALATQRDEAAPAGGVADSRPTAAELNAAVWAKARKAGLGAAAVTPERKATEVAATPAPTASAAASSAASANASATASSSATGAAASAVAAPRGAPFPPFKQPVVPYAGRLASPPPVVGVVFYGRRSRVRILDCYLQRNLARHGGLLTGVVFVSATWEAPDVAFLERLLQLRAPEYSKVVPKRLDQGYTGHYAWMDPGTIYVKIDDDVVYISDAAIDHMLAAHMLGRYHLISANVINHQPLELPHSKSGAHTLYQQTRTGDKGSWEPVMRPGATAGATEPTPFTTDGWDVWGDWKRAASVHYSFLANQAAGRLDRYEFPAGEQLWDFNKHIGYIRWRINMFMFKGSSIDVHVFNMSSTTGTYPGDDEDFITRILPQQLNVTSAAVSPALAVHFSFYPQRGGLENSTDLLDRYALLAERTCGQLLPESFA